MALCVDRQHYFIGDRRATSNDFGLKVYKPLRPQSVTQGKRVNTSKGDRSFDLELLFLLFDLKIVAILCDFCESVNNKAVLCAACEVKKEFLKRTK